MGEVTTATIATIPANTTPTTFRSISGFALPSVIHNNQRQSQQPLHPWFASATALCGTTGKVIRTLHPHYIYIYIYIYIPVYIYIYTYTYIYIYNCTFFPTFNVHFLGEVQEEYFFGTGHDAQSCLMQAKEFSKSCLAKLGASWALNADTCTNMYCMYLYIYIYIWYMHICIYMYAYIWYVYIYMYYACIYIYSTYIICVLNTYTTYTTPLVLLSVILT